MLSINRVSSISPRCNRSHLLSIGHRTSYATYPRPPLRLPLFLRTRTNNPFSVRLFSQSRVFQKDVATEVAQQSQQDIEMVVRETKQRFRDTLPTGYLNEEEYALYVRIYGPPLRETAPEDVGIPSHADMADVPPPQPDGEGTVLRELDEGGFEEIPFMKSNQRIDERKEDANVDAASSDDLKLIVQQAPGYIDNIARNQRERDALHKLMQDFEATQKKQRELELEAMEVEAASAQEQAMVNEQDATEELEEFEEDEYDMDGGIRADQRLHRHTLAGKFAVGPVQIMPPRDGLIKPISQLLDRTHIRHVKAAAEEAFGGRGLPLSPVPSLNNSGHMGGVRLPPDQRSLSEIEADAFLAAYMPPAYVSAAATLHEVRRRLGSGWIQSRLKNGRGLSVLDAGAGGAGLVAWEEVLQAELALFKENGQVQQKSIPGRKTVIAASDRLRHRLKTFLQDTTFLPRLPDYEHSGEMQGEHLEAGHIPQPRKSYDLIIASHLFLKEEVPHRRQAVLNNLWSLLNKDGGVLIIIEKAHPRGFEAVADVRDTILRQFLLPQSGLPENELETFNPAFQREREAGHIVAPCTTQGQCPMYRKAGKSQGRKDYCHFHQRYFRPPFHNAVLGQTAENQGRVEFSYVAIQRGHARHTSMDEKEATALAFKGYENTQEQPDMQTLPRIILPPLKRKGHITLDVCTAEGSIERWTVPKSFSKSAYHDARKSKWGDLWALGAKTRILRTVRIGNGVKPDEKEKRSEKKKGRKHAEVSSEERRAIKKSKNKDKQLDLIQEILEAEAIEEDALEREIDMEEQEEEEEEEEEEHETLRRGGT